MPAFIIKSSFVTLCYINPLLTLVFKRLMPDERMCEKRRNVKLTRKTEGKAEERLKNRFVIKGFFLGEGGRPFSGKNGGGKHSE